MIVSSIPIKFCIINTVSDDDVDRNLSNTIFTVQVSGVTNDVDSNLRRRL